jgi:hypothetical protein
MNASWLPVEKHNTDLGEKETLGDLVYVGSVVTLRTGFSSLNIGNADEELSSFLTQNTLRFHY